MDSSPDVLWQNRLLPFISTCFFPHQVTPTGAPARETPPPAGVSGGSWWKRKGGGGTDMMSEKAGDRGTSCFPTANPQHRLWCEVHLALVTLRYMNDKQWTLGISCMSFQMNASDRLNSNEPFSPTDSAAKLHPHLMLRLREGHRYLQRKIQRVIRLVMTERWHLPFSDINTAQFEGCIFTLEKSQCLSCLHLYNCVCSFKCEAENVSLCAPSTVRWHTMWAIHLPERTLDYFVRTFECSIKSKYCNLKEEKRKNEQFTKCQ